MRGTLERVAGRRGALWIAIGTVLAFALSWVELLYAFHFPHILVEAEQRLADSVGRLAGAATVVIVSGPEGMLRRCDRGLDVAGYAVRSAA